MDNKHLVHIMCIKMLGPPNCPISENAARLPAGDPNPISQNGKGDIALFGDAVVTVMSDNFCISTPQCKKNSTKNKNQEAMMKYRVATKFLNHTKFMIKLV